MKTLFINPAWDAAGCSWKQSDAINKHTDWSARHFRTVNTYNFQSDITPKNYNKDEFISLIEEADILHFCSATHDWPVHSRQFKWGFNWNDFIGRKVKIFHDYCSFTGTWEERAKDKTYWNKAQEIGYNAIFTSIPQAAANVYNGGIYIPDTVDENSPQFTPEENRDFSVLNIGHWPTGGDNNKNTMEFEEACKIAKQSVHFTGGKRPNSNHYGIMKDKRDFNFGFDALWRGYHGMTTVENLALGIPTMCRMDNEFKKRFAEHFQTDEFPFEQTEDVTGLVEVIKKYASTVNLLKERCHKVRKFMEEKWSYKNVANTIIGEYEKLL